MVAGTIGIVAACVGIVAGALLWTVSQTGWRIATSELIVEDCSIITMPNLTFELEVPAPLSLLRPEVQAVRVSTEDARRWGIVREVSAADALIGLSYCIVQGPPWTIERIDSGPGASFPDMEWIGSMDGDGTLQIPSEDAWIVAESSASAVTFQWFVDINPRVALIQIAIVSVLVTVLALVVLGYCWRRSRTITSQIEGIEHD